MAIVMVSIKFMGLSANMMKGITNSINAGDICKAMYLLSGLYNCAYRYYKHGCINAVVYNRTYLFYTDMMRQLL